MSKRNFIECFPNEDGAFNIPNPNLWIKEYTKPSAGECRWVKVEDRIPVYRKPMRVPRNPPDMPYILIVDWDNPNEYVVKTSLGVKEVCYFEEDGTWSGDLREDEKITKWLDESPSTNKQSDEGLKDWISVEDGLPDFDIKVLVMGEGKGMNPQMGGAYISIARRQDLSKTSMAKDAARYQDKNQFSSMNYVTHWMPLPTPPNNIQTLK